MINKMVSYLRQNKDKKSFRIINCTLQCILWILLFLFAFRKSNQGVDLWDTGYNYANYVNMGLEHMDGMWLFSTYLSTAIGHFFTLLPGGTTLLGLNIYTTCVSAVLVLCVSMFYKRIIKVPVVLIIFGEFIALCLCWAPSAILYDYLTFLFLDVALIFLYMGLAREKKTMIFFSGIALGANIFIRFSNLAQVAVGFIVIAYYILHVFDNKLKKIQTDFAYIGRKMLEGLVSFLTGYVLSIAVVLGYISIRYGLSSYIEGISELLSMSKTVPGYSVSFMFSFLVNTLFKYLVRLWRIVGAISVGMCITYFAQKVDEKINKKMFQKLSGVICTVLAVAVIWDYYTKCDYIIKEFTNFDSVYAPFIMLSLITMCVAVIRVLTSSCELHEKLLGGIVVAVYLLSSVGSSTELHLGMNNLFLGIPYLLWEVYKLCRKKDAAIPLFPIKIVICVFICFCCYFAIGFGNTYVYTEAGSVRERTAKLDNHPILKGVYMTQSKADILGGISDYVMENHLTGREVILYNMNPGLSFYLQMPPAFNCWISLGSYSGEKLEKDLEESAKEAIQPIIILTCGFEEDEGKKALMLKEYMSEQQYDIKYNDGYYSIYSNE